MQTFALIVLIAFLIALTHTHNYCLRLIVRNAGGDAGIFCFISSVLYGIAVFFILKYIIIWGYPLIV